METSKELGLTFIMPVYNGAKTIQKTIRSILNQKDINIKLVVLDNGSTDETVSICLSFEDKRLQVISLPHTQSLGVSLSRSFSAEIEPPFCVCHSDDIYYPDFASEMTVAIEKYSDFDVFFCNAKIIGSNNLEISSLKNAVKKLVNRVSPNLSGQLSVLRLFFFNSLIAPTACFSKKIDPQQFQFHAEYVFFTDVHLWSSLLFKGSKIKIVNVDEIGYRVHDDQQSHRASLWEKQKKELTSLRDEFATLADQPIIFKLLCSAAIYFRLLIYKLGRPK